MIAKIILEFLIYPSIILIIQVVSMTFCSFWSDKIKKTIIPISISIGVISLIAIPVILAYFNFPQNNSSKYVFILILSCILNFGLGIYNILIYKLPYEIYDISDYGKYTSISGILSGIVGFACTSLLSFFANIFSYKNVITVFLY